MGWPCVIILPERSTFKRGKYNLDNLDTLDTQAKKHGFFPWFPAVSGLFPALFAAFRSPLRWAGRPRELRAGGQPGHALPSGDQRFGLPLCRASDAAGRMPGGPGRLGVSQVRKRSSSHELRQVNVYRGMKGISCGCITGILCSLWWTCAKKNGKNHPRWENSQNFDWAMASMAMVGMTRRYLHPELTARK